MRKCAVCSTSTKIMSHLKNARSSTYAIIQYNNKINDLIFEANNIISFSNTLIYFCQHNINMKTFDNLDFLKRDYDIHSTLFIIQHRH